MSWNGGSFVPGWSRFLSWDRGVSKDCVSSWAVADLCVQPRGAAGAGDDGGGPAAPQDLPWLVLELSAAGQELGLAVPRGSLSPPVPLAGAVPGSWVPRGAEPAQGGVMLMLLPSPRRSRCHSASSPGHGRHRLGHGHLPRAAAWARGTGAAPVPGRAREGAERVGGTDRPGAAGRCHS